MNREFLDWSGGEGKYAQGEGTILRPTNEQFDLSHRSARNEMQEPRRKGSNPS